MFETGRVCVKTAGRESGRICVVVEKTKEMTVLVTGPRAVTGVRRRMCNIDHLEPLTEKVEIKDKATDEEVLKAYEKADLFKKLNLKKTNAEDLKAAEHKSAENKARADKESKDKAAVKEKKVADHKPAEKHDNKPKTHEHASGADGKAAEKKEEKAEPKAAKHKASGKKE